MNQFNLNTELFPIMASLDDSIIKANEVGTPLNGIYITEAEVGRFIVELINSGGLSDNAKAMPPHVLLGVVKKHGVQYRGITTKVSLFLPG